MRLCTCMFSCQQLFEEFNSGWDQQCEQQLLSDFCPPVNCDYSDSNTAAAHDNINNSHMWSQEQSINPVASNIKSMYTYARPKTLV